ncbi:hypothetical protein KR51_00001950 [Rubidibacter lacunae KORDI 51-2]|uniref:Uncharacterized protein n=1 Tax=Rubidibacter lacunae KORDI 51-2 TaxID=582515 RepID=U5DT88_9CHRO|nr:hypothetical protein [Rubidibacter lacunae]ERN42900.1 hypothetical protein KR51_00001950 [Rubidibacter lacunae KORDI 51-2]
MSVLRGETKLGDLSAVLRLNYEVEIDREPRDDLALAEQLFQRLQQYPNHPIGLVILTALPQSPVGTYFLLSMDSLVQPAPRRAGWQESPLPPTFTDKGLGGT